MPSMKQVTINNQVAIRTDLRVGDNDSGLDISGRPWVDQGLPFYCNH